MPTAEKLMTEKLGLKFDAARTHKYSNAMSGEFIYQKFGEGERLAIQGMIEECYDLFTKRCAEGRGMTQDDIKKIAEGRVWVGKTAAELGLVDSIGSIDDAIAYAAQVSELEDYKVANYPAVKSSFEKLMEQFGSTSRMTVASWILGEDTQLLQALRTIENTDIIQCRMDNITIE